ncbi:type IV pilin-like G/H family protein [Cyanobium gracile]|uniref:Type IV pilin-like G/H family protein n=1 Tax=Cyanobium gracile UHCC 0281 TaxID=3110309 RepID=A0ABU5SRR2_9CYAN|nr:type IV pilin-like G/H family protein [Cyanobium gracile]MEA5441204.1 type IV pilin-like G/H family protein [Cyanobium gracile UHCC 0281]
MTSLLPRHDRPTLLACLLLGIAATCPGAGAQPQTSPDQTAALNAVARMMEAQRTYYQRNGAFRATVSNIQRDFGITLPASFNDAVRTTTEAAYSYVIPAQSPKMGQLNAYVGAAFLTPTQNPRITTIICMNSQPGQIRPADPQLVLGSLVANPTGRVVQCGDASVEVTASVVNE